jgi:hypothetical protein
VLYTYDPLGYVIVVLVEVVALWVDGLLVLLDADPVDDPEADPLLLLDAEAEPLVEAE